MVEEVNWPWNGFGRYEFACHCGCGFDTVDGELLTLLEDLKAHFDNSVVRINSGCRCTDYNRFIGGVEGSQHQLGRAADIVVDGHSHSEVYGYLTSMYIGRYGFGRYSTFVHVDTRSKGVWRQN